jgi:FtsZ-interacting cell division protein ZipA
MGLRELLILLLILAIVGVILRGLYVALRARRGQLRMALDKNIPQYDHDELLSSELPNGGARLVQRFHVAPLDGLHRPGPKHNDFRRRRQQRRRRRRRRSARR